jgi:hypothetical protein
MRLIVKTLLFEAQGRAFNLAHLDVRSVFLLQHRQLAFYCIPNGGDRVGWSGDTAAEPADGSSNQSPSSRSEPAISTLVDSSQRKLSQMLKGVTGQVVWWG